MSTNQHTLFGCPRACPPSLPRGSCDLGNGYALLRPRELCDIGPLVASAFDTFAETHGWRMISTESLLVHRFAHVLLPNGQIARSSWQEKKHSSEKVRIARNIKVWLYFLGVDMCLRVIDTVGPRWCHTLHRGPILFLCGE